MCATWLSSSDSADPKTNFQVPQGQLLSPYVSFFSEYQAIGKQIHESLCSRRTVFAPEEAACETTTSCLSEPQIGSLLRSFRAIWSIQIHEAPSDDKIEALSLSSCDTFGAGSVDLELSEALSSPVSEQRRLGDSKFTKWRLSTAIL